MRIILIDRFGQRTDSWQLDIQDEILVHERRHLPSLAITGDVAPDGMLRPYAVYRPDGTEDGVPIYRESEWVR